ncbi:hypothetical protein MACJ_001284 [Theileria orientalis]|uniref:Proteasome maturation factor UMP1 n=1 Tax=Theileria orientalis TaxID=68886 RepID=A0A976M8B3_THEOR|nr:hypothetical protein MACJ_001284 [Theileria orientalis]
MDNNNLSHLNIDLNSFPNTLLDNFENDTSELKLHNIHPINNIDYNHIKKSAVESNARIARCFGSQETLKMSIERNMCSKSTRLPGMKSSMLSLEILMGELDTLQNYDYMNDEKPFNEFGLGGIHSHIENKMNL